MNIFVLDADVKRCAECHLDKHTVKMILETTQLLNNAMISNHKDYQPAYKPTHLKHPCSLWTSKSGGNFQWLCNLGLALCEEYTFRYGKIHKCQSHIEMFNKNADLNKNEEMTPFALCMPDQYKTLDPVSAYRAYYLGEKKEIAKWTKREKPEWWNI